MKRFCFVLLILFSVFQLFAEDVELVPWNYTRDNIISFYTNKGWIYLDSPETSANYFIFTPSQDIYYNHKKISFLIFHFHNGIFFSQSIVLKDTFSKENVYETILDFAITDKVLFFQKSIDNKSNIILYGGKTGDNKISYEIIPNGYSFNLRIDYFE